MKYHVPDLPYSYLCSIYDQVWRNAGRRWGGENQREAQDPPKPTRNENLLFFVILIVRLALPGLISFFWRCMVSVLQPVVLELANLLSDESAVLAGVSMAHGTRQPSFRNKREALTKEFI